MKDVKDITCLFIDHTLFLPLALRLGQTYKRVLYSTPWEKAFPLVEDCVIGDGFEEVERCDDYWQAVDNGEVDLVVCPDVMHAGLQLHFEKLGIPVWGSRKGDALEMNRDKFLRVLKDVGLDVPPYERVVGTTALADHLRDKEDVYIKISKYRGTTETKHFRSWALDQTLIYKLAIKFGPCREQIPFLVFDAIDTDIELGGDTYGVDGLWPSIMLQGYEWKDKGYFSAVTDKEKMPEDVLNVLEAFSPFLAQNRYRNQWSMEIRKTKDKAYFIDATCFSEDTEILTEHGWKKFPELLANEKVCTLNPDTQKIEYQSPLNYVSYRHEGQMVRISSPKRVLDLLVTPNHSVWAFNRKGGLIQTPAIFLNYPCSIPRTGIWDGIEQQYYRIPDYVKKWHSGKGKGIDKEFRVVSRQIEMDLWLKFLAIFLSEGHVHKHQIEITQTKRIDLFRSVIESIGFSFHQHKKGFTINSIQLADHLKNTGKRHERSIPDWIKTLSSRQIRIFLDYYMLGDGTFCKKERMASTTSKSTADDLQELFLKAGSVGDIVVRSRAGSSVDIGSKGYISKHDALEVRERTEKRRFYCEGWHIKRQKNLSMVHYEGMVYDVEVPNHIVFVRRNGKACFSGNCRGGLPSTGSQIVAWKNLPEIILAGANGELADPVPDCQFTAECVLTLKRQKGEWGETEIPAKLAPWMKLANCCCVDGVIGFPPDDEPEIGWLLAKGDTPEETVEQMKAHAAMLPDGVEAHLTSLVDLLKEIQEAEKQGIEFTDQSVPDPEVVVAD